MLALRRYTHSSPESQYFLRLELDSMSSPCPQCQCWHRYKQLCLNQQADHPRSKKCRNIWQALYKMRGVISARFKNTLLFYGGLELLHGQFKQEETHTDTPGVKSLRGWRGWTPYYPLTPHSRAFTLGFCDFCNFWNVDSTRPGKKDGCRALSTFRWPVTSSYGLFYLAYEAASAQCLNSKCRKASALEKMWKIERAGAGSI